MIKVTKLKQFAIATGALLFGASAYAGDKCLVIDDKCPVECCKEDPCWCEIFDYSTLYDNEDACLVQKVALVGRYHGQYLNNSLDIAGTNYEGDYWEHRRFRLGTKVQFLNDFTFFNNWNIANNDEFAAGDFFDTIDEMYIKWAPSDNALGDIGFNVSVGKVKQKITREFSTSSKKILTLERSHIVNEVADNKPWGVVVGFKALGLKHKVAGYLNGATGEHNWPEYTRARGSVQYSAEYGLTDNTDLFFDYLFTNNNDGRSPEEGHAASDEAASDYNHVVALGTESAWDIGCCDRQYGLITDMIWGRGRDGDSETSDGFGDAIPEGEDTFGLVILPYYDVTERLQLVGRYAYASVSRLQRPHRRDSDPVGGTIPRVNMEDVHTAYVGFNYRLCGDNLKLLGGYEYLSGNLYGSDDGLPVRGDSWSIGVRTYW